MNDTGMNHSALEGGDLSASFKPYRNLIIGVVASLSLKNAKRVFCDVVATQMRCLFFFVSNIGGSCQEDEIFSPRK